MTVSIKQAQLQLTELIDRSSRGEEIVIANEGGRAVARIVPETSMPQQQVSVLELISSLPKRNHTREQWEQIERDLQQERDTWDR